MRDPKTIWQKSEPCVGLSQIVIFTQYYQSQSEFDAIPGAPVMLRAGSNIATLPISVNFQFILCAAYAQMNSKRFQNTLDFLKIKRL